MSKRRNRMSELFATVAYAVMAGGSIAAAVGWPLWGWEPAGRYGFAAFAGGLVALVWVGLPAAVKAKADQIDKPG